MATLKDFEVSEVGRPLRSTTNMLEGEKRFGFGASEYTFQKTAAPRTPTRPPNRFKTHLSPLEKD